MIGTNVNGDFSANHIDTTMSGIFRWTINFVMFLNGSKFCISICGANGKQPTIEFLSISKINFIRWQWKMQIVRSDEVVANTLPYSCIDATLLHIFTTVFGSHSSVRFIQAKLIRFWARELAIILLLTRHHLCGEYIWIYLRFVMCVRQFVSRFCHCFRHPERAERTFVCGWLKTTCWQQLNWTLWASRH